MVSPVALIHKPLHRFHEGFDVVSTAGIPGMHISPPHHRAVRPWTKVRALLPVRDAKWIQVWDVEPLNHQKLLLV